MYVGSLLFLGSLLSFFALSIGMDPSFSKFLVFALTFISGNWASTSLGQFVSSFSANPFIGLTLCKLMCRWLALAAPLSFHISSCFAHTRNVHLLYTHTVPAFVAPMIMFSGILYERSSVPWWLGWIQSLSIVNYSFSALMIQQIHILPKPLGLLVMQFVQLNPNDMAWDIAMLWIMNFGFQVLTYINLTLRLRFSAVN